MVATLQAFSYNACDMDKVKSNSTVKITKQMMTKLVSWLIFASYNWSWVCDLSIKFVNYTQFYYSGSLLSPLFRLNKLLIPT